MFRDEIMSMEGDLFEIYKDLHQHPEPGHCEHRTAGIIAEFLKNCGLEVQSGVGITGVVGLLDSGKPGKTLLIRADMDCLRIPEASGLPYASVNEGMAHACGHDAHVTMLLGAASVLSAHKEAFSGKIKFIFQPNEENYLDGHPIRLMVEEKGYRPLAPDAGLGGAGCMIQDGVMEGVDACIALHVQPNLPLGTVYISKTDACASTDFMDVTIQGKGGHGSMPHQAIDPVPAMAELIQALYMLPTREADAAEKWVFHVGAVETPGSIASAVADKAVLHFGYRAFRDNTRALFTRRCKELAEHIAAANRCTVSINHGIGYRPTINDESMSALVAESCRKELGDDHVIYTDVPNMTAEDCGEYFRIAPGCLLWLGTGIGENPPALHNPAFCVDRSALPIGVRIHVANALAYLNS